MKPAILLIIIFAFAGCGNGGSEEAAAPQLSKDPVSVRGWIADVEGANRGEVRTAETEAARLTELFRSTSVWIENVPYVSGGMAETGAFILLDVPPGDVTISFNAPGAETAAVELKNIPGNADVLIPAIMLRNGGATLLQPEGVRVRVPAAVDAPRSTGRTATVAGVPVPVIDTPIRAFSDRRDYPERGLRPVAIVK